MAAGASGLRLLKICGESSFYSIIRRSLHCTCPRRGIIALGFDTWKPGNLREPLDLFPSSKYMPGSQMHYMRHLGTKPSQPQKKSDSRKLDLKQGPTIQYHELPIIFVNANYNNTMFTITDHNGMIAARTSAGMEGFKGAKRGTNYAGQMAATAAAKKAKSLGIRTLRVKIKGMGPGRNSSIKGLMAGGVDIVSITDVTPVPHNGCKPPKQRRI